MANLPNITDVRIYFLKLSWLQILCTLKIIKCLETFPRLNNFNSLLAVCWIRILSFEKLSLNECSTEHWRFSEKAFMKNWEFLKYKNTAKIWTPVFSFYFCLMNLWFVQFLRIIANLLLKNIWSISSLIKFWSRETKYWKYHIYILTKKVIILRKINVTIKSFPPRFSIIERN